jgi:hypothetical protein
MGSRQFSYNFGAAVKRLFELPGPLGTALGMASRIFSFARNTTAHAKYPNLQFSDFLHNSSHGIGLINTETE